MSWEHRSYSWDSGREARPGPRNLLLTPVTLGLLIVHATGFLIVQMMLFDVGREAAAFFPLVGAASHPAAIVLHPVSTQSVLSLAFVLLIIWSAGKTLESALGGIRLLRAYLAGNLVAGGVYFGLARLLPGSAQAPLMEPIGALAAWSALAVQHLGRELTPLFGRSVSLRRLIAICCSVVALLMLVRYGAGSAAWLVAACCGGAFPLAFELARLVRPWRGPRRRRIETRPAREGRTAPSEADIDEILAKISREGLGSLTELERARLEEARQLRLRRASSSRGNVR
ncbi:MAG: hypothetical protein HRF50_03960 [Phycisphaerae bacterium]|jgi:membrane associated rhomboid family serine protease